MKLREIADFLSSELVGNGNIEIDGVAPFDTAAHGQIAFLEKTDAQPAGNASCIIVPLDFEGGGAVSLIRSSNPKAAFSRVAALLHPAKQRREEIHPSAEISKSAEVGKGVFVGAFCCIGDGSVIAGGTQLCEGVKIGNDVKLGSDCILYPNVVIEDGCSIGSRVILHAGVVIGADGFGFVRDGDEYIKFPQIGSVVIENDVEIGANSCVDRGALGVTRIGEGTKIDNLVQVGHNVDIGKRCVIAAQTGISGSVTIEDDCVIGGQVGFGDHVRVQSGAVIGSQAGILPGKIVRPGVWWGTPIQPLDEYKRQNAHLKGIGRLKADVKELKRKLTETTGEENA